MLDITLGREAVFDGAQYMDVELTRRSNDKACFRLALIKPEQCAEVQALETAVYESLENKDVYSGPLTPEETMRVIQGGIIIGAFYEGEIVGATTLVIEPDAPDSHATQLDDATDSVTYSSSFVKREYRGWGLQRQFSALREKAARAMGARIAVMTISPDNTHSLNNSLKAGFKIARRANLYHGLDRYILIREFKA